MILELEIETNLKNVRRVGKKKKNSDNDYLKEGKTKDYDRENILMNREDTKLIFIKGVNTKEERKLQRYVNEIGQHKNNGKDLIGYKKIQID